MKALWRWIDSRTGLGECLGQCRAARVPGRPCFCRTLPCLLVFAFFMQAVTGVFMLMRYCPSSTTAWESVYYLQYDTQGGWLLRAVHHYCGQAVLVLVGVYLVGMIFRGTYRAPRECVFWCVLFLGMVTLGLLLTGDLLSWDQNSHSATLTRVGFLQSLPVVGGSLFKLAAAGPEFGNLTLSQFTTLHAVVLAGAFCGLLVLRWWFARRAAAVEPAPSVDGSSYWPNQALLNVIACLILLAVILGLAVSHGTIGDTRGVELGVPADQTSFYDAARPEWAFMGLYGFAKLDIFSGDTIMPVFVVPTVVVCLFLLMPFIGRFRAGHIFNVLLIVVLLVGNGYLAFHVVADDRANEEHQAVIRRSRLAAERLPVLIRRHGGIPPTGARTLLNDDPKVQGPLLFAQHCATCHNYVGGTPDDIKAEESSAPNLFRFGSREWLEGFLDPKGISGDQYFGNTAFKNGKMADFVKEELGDIFDEEPKDRDLMVMALSAEAKLSSQREIDRRDASQISEGRILLGDYCTDCHRFGRNGRLGTAPDLTGYGSREWTIGIVRDPTLQRFYGRNNDRMPAYAETDDQSMNLMTDRQIEVLVDWLRGDWYETAE
ncbi:MAG TPA: menaquinol-cytochrome C reductase [Planctomycetaceae bacterium]|nr:menaquinol-cytochrome C reductase [Planctomycetaceae bacterium]